MFKPNHQVNINVEIALWLRTSRERVRLTTSEASQKTGLSENLISFWEQGYPMPISALLILVIIYQVPATVTAAKIKAFQEYFESGP